jgi:hypothetical protein
VWPFLFEDLDEGEVEFGDEYSLLFHEGFVGGDLDDFAYYVVFDAFSLFWWEDFPSEKGRVCVLVLAERMMIDE